MFITYKMRLLKRHIFRLYEGERILKKRYKEFFGKDLDTKNPLLFSEKLFNKMIMLHRRPDSRLTRLADKYLARDYVRDLIGEKYLVKLIWDGLDPRNIPFDLLPETCIVKTNHGSGGNIILNNTEDRLEVIKKLRKWLGENYYWGGREYQYYDIKPRVLIEELLNDAVSGGPLDYRFWCFDGRPVVIQVDDHSHSINPFFDLAWNKLSLYYRENFKECDIRQPENLQEMLKIASTLSAGFDFVRVDLYNISGRIYFGEFTFTPVGGRLKIRPEFWDKDLGNNWVTKS